MTQGSLAADPTGYILRISGPEGDFTPAEIAAAFVWGIRPVTPGHSPLRTETAALVAVHTVHVARELAGSYSPTSAEVSA